MTSNVAKWLVIGALVIAAGCGEEGASEPAQLPVSAEEQVLGCEAAPAAPAPQAVVAAEAQPQKLALLCPVNPEGTASLDCDADPSNGCEVDPYSDAQNCGGCGLACPGEFPSCIQKRCCNVEDRECM